MRCEPCRTPGKLFQPWNGELPAGNERDWRALNLPGAGGTGDEPLLELAERNCAVEKGKPARTWLLEAEEVGTGGENGFEGY